MHEEKALQTAVNSSLIYENDLPFNVFKTQKIESLTHSLLLDSSRSKVIVWVTRKSRMAQFGNSKHLALAEGFDLTRKFKGV